MTAPLKVLVADDNPVFLRLLDSFVRKCGYAPVPAADGDQAYALLARDDAPRLAVVDWEMPGRTGLDICREIRALGRPKPTYIILLTARTEPQEVVEGLAGGASDYVRKPMHHEEMRLRLGTWARIVRMESELLREHASESARSELPALAGELESWWAEAVPLMCSTPTGRILAAQMEGLSSRLRAAAGAVAQAGDQGLRGSQG